MSKALVVTRRIRKYSERGTHMYSGRGTRRFSERGAASAEYAVTMVAACGFAGILIALLKSSAMMSLLKAIINFALKAAGVEGVQI